MTLRCGQLLLAGGAFLMFAACGATPSPTRPKLPAAPARPAPSPPDLAVKLAPEAIEPARLKALTLPRAQQLATFRQWATADAPEPLQVEALRQLAWAGDKSVIEFSLRALDGPSLAVRMAAVQALAEFGATEGQSAKPGLRRALANAGDLRPQIVWALVELGETSIVEDALELCRAQAFDNVTRLGGAPAFDRPTLARLISHERLVALSRDTNPELRILSGVGLSQHADSKSTDVLIRLLQDPIPEVSREAAAGLALVGEPRALKALRSALSRANKEDYEDFLQALRDGAGALGLASALAVTHRDAKLQQYRLSALFEYLHGLESVAVQSDSRAGDLMLEWLKTKPHPHFRARVGFALAEMGDLRALPILAERLGQDPIELYAGPSEFNMTLRRDDGERIHAARLIVDLVDIYPTQIESIRHEVESALIQWLHEMPSPHANGMRALAAMGSTKDIAQLREWSNPSVPLPREGQQPPLPEEWIIAQSALRAVGVLKDQQSWPVLTSMLNKRPKHVDVTMESLMQGGLAILGMSLRAIGYGAANGLSEWADPKAFDPLLQYIENPKENEQSRTEACVALGWVARAEDGTKIVSHVLQRQSNDKPDQFVRACLLEALISRPRGDAVPRLMSRFTPDVQLEERHRIARAIGMAGVNPALEGVLFKALENEALMLDAALALMLGGDAATAARAVAIVVKAGHAVAIEELSELWSRSFGYWSEEVLTKGKLHRWVQNATAIAHLNIEDKFATFASDGLKKQLDGLLYDQGPHTLTRGVLRARLFAMATSANERPRDQALDILEFMRAQGALLALRDEPGALGQLAEAAYRRVRHPSPPEANSPDGLLKKPATLH